MSKSRLNGVLISNGNVAEAFRQVYSGDNIRTYTRFRPGKPSAIRDFPPGCGRSAKHFENGTIEGGVAAQQESVKTSEVRHPESQDPHLNSDRAALSSSINLESEAAIASRITTDLPGKCPKIELDSPETLNQNTRAVLNFSERTGASYLLANPVPPQELSSSAVNSNPEPCVRGCYRGRISARRDFPPYCGRNAPPLPREECLKPLEEDKKHDEVVKVCDRENLEGSDSGQVRETSQAGDVCIKNDETSDFEGLDVKFETVDSNENSAYIGNYQSPVENDGVEVEKVAADGGAKDMSTEQLKCSVDEDFTSKDEGCAGTAPSPDKAAVQVPLSIVNPPAHKANSLSRSKRGSVSGASKHTAKKRQLTSHHSIEQNEIKFENSDAHGNKTGVQNLGAQMQAEKFDGEVKKLFVHGDGKGEVPQQSESHAGVDLPLQEEDNTVQNASPGEDVFHAPNPAANPPAPKANSRSRSNKRPSVSGTSGQTTKKRQLTGQQSEEQNDDRKEHSSRGTVTIIPLGIPDLSGTSNGNDSEEIVTRNRVRETLRLFQACCRKLLQEEESKSKGDGQGVKRIDLRVSALLKEKDKWVNTGKQILGSVPGVEVGDEFHYRVELALIGLHRQYMAGIDYLKEKGRVLATSIVSSGGYNDDIDSSDILIYSGHGGNPTGADKKQTDQKLERGNLAMKNSMDAQTPVRVIRGIRENKAGDSQDTKSRSVATYTYDGLYVVERYWMEKEHHGCLVFKFQLRRIPGQPELALREVKKSRKLAVREGVCVQDISQGQEKMQISAVNTVDDEKPLPFKYTSKMIYPSWHEPSHIVGCDCTNGCSDLTKCICVLKNGGEIPFNHDGAIVEAKPLVYECGPSCKCPPSCHNRVSQHGIRFQLEVFKTESRGWGVRSLTSIPSGSFICEYAGELLQEIEAEQRTGNDEYLFDIGHNYSDHSLWDGLSTIMPEICTSAICEVVENSGFTIDAAEYGNVGRFINHSCSPNLYAQNVLYDHDDKRMPHIMLFAAENIPPLQELTYHYNYKIDTVHDAHGNIKKKPCYCGSHDCTGRLY